MPFSLGSHMIVVSPTFDAAPLWPLLSPPLKLPLKQWGFGYLAEATGQSFEEIYKNTHGGRDAWAAAWRAAARHFRGDAAIHGYELINEPFPGDIFHDPLLLLPGEAGRRNLMPAYNEVAAAIRKEDDETIVMFEPLTWGMIFPTAEGVLPRIAGSGFDSVPGGAAYANRSAFSFHYYCWLAQGISEQKPSSAPYAPLQKAECDRAFGPLVFDSVEDSIAHIGGASIMTEFGAMTPNTSNPTSVGTEEVEWVLGEADRRFQSWTYWDMCSLFTKDTAGQHVPNMEALRAFIRPYARAIAGTPRSTSFDYSSGNYSLAYEIGNVADAALGSSAAPTEIYLPSLVYPRGYVLAVSPSGLTCGACPLYAHVSPKLAHDLLCCSAPPSVAGLATISVVRKA